MSHHHDAGILAERVYKWAVDDLGYRPDTTDILGASPYTTTGLTPQNTTLASANFQPQDLYHLCSGPLASIFEHLTLNIRPRREAQNAQDQILYQRRQHVHGHQGQVAHNKRQAVNMKQRECRDLAQQIARKRQEIASCKESIKRHRQMSMATQQYHDRSRESITVLQEYHRELITLERGISRQQPPSHQHDGHESRRSLAPLKSDTHGLCHLLVLAAKETVAKKTRTTDRQHQNLTSQATSLHAKIKGIPGGPKLFLETIQSLQSHLLQDFDTRNPTSSEPSKSAEILKIFRAHHAERLEQVEMVLSQMAEQEQQKEDLIEHMQQSMKTLEQSGGHAAMVAAGIHLELEIAKAQVAGLSTSLEFVQAEQELLIERALSTEDPSARLEAIGRGSRAAQQKCVQAQRTLQQLAQLLITEHETLRDRMTRSRQDMTEITPLLTQLVQLAQERLSSVEQGYHARLERLKQQQEERLHSARPILLPLSPFNHLERSDPRASNASNAPWLQSSYSLAPPHISQDRQTLDRVALHAELRLQASLVEQMKTTQRMMAGVAEQLSTRWKQGIETCQGALKQAYPDIEHEVDAVKAALDTKDPVVMANKTNLEAEALAVIEAVEKFDHLQEQAAIQRIQHSVEQSEAALVTLEQIESLVQEARMLQDCQWDQHEKDTT
ncbi:hypothetical protein BGZ73_003751 [Actinomortierella ambigua]|nr:hypothetical protein BGZ73_003751 [Actinomortierella ambigua]